MWRDGQQVEGGGGGAAAPIGTADPLEGLELTLRGLEVINGWLAGAEVTQVDGMVVQGLLVGLGQVDAAATAARAQAITACELTGLPAADGAANPSAWTGEQLRLSGAAAARECAFAAALAGMGEVLAALAAGQISREHAVGLVAARRQQQADADAAEAARQAREQAEREARLAAAAAAAAAQADERRRHQAMREAAARERAMAARQAAQAEARRAAAAQAQAARQADLLGRAAGGQRPDALRRRARQLRNTDPEALERDAVAQQARRSVRSWIDKTTGMGMTVMALPLEHHERWLAAREAARTLDPAETPQGERRTAEQREADAVIDLIDLVLRSGELATSGGVKPHLVIHVPVDTMAGGQAPGRGRYDSDLAAEAVRRTGCDATFSRLVLDPAGQPLDLGRATRDWSVAQRRAIEARDGGCRFPLAPGVGCDRPVGWTAIHHVVWWRRGGVTAVHNGVLLCGYHHHAVHHDGWHLDLDPATGTVTLNRTNPDGSHTHRTSPPATRLQQPT